jgi:hypothetical protein
MKWATLLVALLLVLALIPASDAAITPNYSMTSPYSGYVQNNVRYLTTIKASTGPPDAHGFMQWDTTSIPDNATITSATLTLDQITNPVAVDTLIRAVAHKPSTASNATVYNDVGAGAVYGTIPFADSGATVYTLTAQAATDLEADLAADWFAVGFTNAGGWASFLSNTTCTLEVLYYYTTIHYAFSAKWENGTATTVTVTSNSIDGNDAFTVGTNTTRGFTVRPVAFTWNTPMGDARYIYPVADTGSFTIFQPVGTCYNYEFTIRDYARRMTGTCYLEAYTNGVLNQRVIIVSGNPTPMNLDYGQTYNIQVLFGDGTRFNWANMVASTTLTKTISIMGLNFDSTAHFISQFITVQVTATGGDIYVLYEDTKLGTIWANVTIRIRNGAVVYTNQSNANIELWHYVGLANTTYTVSIAGNNQRLTLWGYTKDVNGAESFPSAPIIGVGGLGWTLGVLDLTNALATVISFIAGIAVFSFQWRRISVLVVAAMASIFTWIGLATWSYELLAVVWLVGFGVLLVVPSGGDGN